LTTFLAMVFILPLNWTAHNPCTDCGLTDYDTTTLANIPPITEDNNGIDLLFRLYMIVICNWIVSIYSLILVEQEWKENLGLRRAFYLEADIHQNRKNELQDTVGSMTTDDFDENSFTSVEEQRDNEIKRAFYRDPWIPHPEERETVPNIELYSVLVHNLPGLPDEVMDDSHQEDVVTFSRRQSMDWQLCVATSFFDHIVPNQPGFSSSVAAVTVLPTATELATAWRRWYTAAGKLRRLRFIRNIIAQKRQYDIESHDDEHEMSSEISASTRNSTSSAKPSFEFALNAATSSNTYGDDDHVMSKEEEEFHRKCREVFGARDNVEVEAQFFKALDYGPEQTAIYTRESAQGAAACCPHGCAEERLLTADFQELIDMEKEAVEEVNQANVALLKAQKEAAMLDENSQGPEDNQNPEDPDIGANENELGLGIELELPRKASKSSNSSNSNISKFPSLNSLDLPEKLQTESELFDSYKKSPLVISNSNRSQSHNSQEDLPPKNITTGPMERGMPKHPPAPTNRNLNILLNDKNNMANSGANAMKDIMHTIDESPRKSFDHYAQTPPIKNHQLSMYPPTTPKTPGSLPIPRSLSMKTPNTMSSQIGVRSSKRTSSIVFNGGKFELRHFDSIPDDEEMQSDVGSMNTPKHRMSQLNLLDDESVTSFRTLFPLTTQSVTQQAQPMTRRRLNSSNSSNQGPVSDQWLRYEKIRDDDRSFMASPTKGKSGSNDESYEKNEKPFSGVYRMVPIPHPRELVAMIIKFIRGYFSVKTAINELARENTVAVVTFTSRQAAASARHCLADGRGAQRWVADADLPVPPLADAASCDLKTCRGCCRPVTVSINKRQKMVRKYM